MEQVVLLHFAVAMDQAVEVAATHYAAAPKHICVLWFCVAHSSALKRTILCSNNPLCSHSISNAPKKMGLKETPIRFACRTKRHASLRLSCCGKAQNVIRRPCPFKSPTRSFATLANVINSCASYWSAVVNPHVVLAISYMLKSLAHCSTILANAVNSCASD